MAMKNSYKPANVTITSTSATATAVPYINKDGELPKWDKLLLAGVAKKTNGSIIANGAVAIWLSVSSVTAAGSIGNADYMTFTDASGRYGITIEASKKYFVQFYS